MEEKTKDKTLKTSQSRSQAINDLSNKSNDTELSPEKRIDAFNKIMELKHQQHKDVIGSIINILKKEELSINEVITLLDDTKSVILQTIFK